MKDNFLFEYVETKTFQEQLKKLCRSLEEENAIKDYVGEFRNYGDPINKYNIRKIRFPIKGKGKRGGARIIYYFTEKTDDSFILFFTIYTKGKKEDLTEKETKLLVDYLQFYLQKRRKEP
jgi:mRNA-degrading endonuclease RelE of RelBE toxin-antitoxin system